MGGSAKAPRRKGFTLIELLVVVAIIALLIAILLPALSKARSQARTTLCLTRIAQLTKAMLLYAEDYNETPPFVSTMHYYGNDVPDPNERWLVDTKTESGGDDQVAIDLMREIAYGFEPNWPLPVPRNGMLFSYTRFENLYKCPEFERIADPDKAHNAFNYTRAIWARYYRPQLEAIEDGVTDCDAAGDVQGPIMKPSMVYNPAAMPMMLDEQWDRHVATAGNTFGCSANPYDSPYVCNDYGFFIDNIIAVSHGAPTTSDLHELDVKSNPFTSPHLWKRGGVGFYDGHAELMRDPWPTFELGENERSPANSIWRFGSKRFRYPDEVSAVKAFISAMTYWQRGFDARQRWASLLEPPI